VSGRRGRDRGRDGIDIHSRYEMDRIIDTDEDR